MPIEYRRVLFEVLCDETKLDGTRVEWLMERFDEWMRELAREEIRETPGVGHEGRRVMAWKIETKEQYERTKHWAEAFEADAMKLRTSVDVGMPFAEDLAGAAECQAADLRNQMRVWERLKCEEARPGSDPVLD